MSCCNSYVHKNPAMHFSGVYRVTSPRQKTEYLGGARLTQTERIIYIFPIPQKQALAKLIIKTLPQNI